MEYQTVYFEKSGPENTDETLRIAREWSDRLGVKSILVASTSGATGVKAVNRFTAHEVFVVSHSTGFSQPDVQELFPENRQQIVAAYGKILTCQHALAGVSRAVRYKLGTYEIDEIIANALRIFGQGMKVAIEIALMAADAGFVPTDKDVISVGGTNSGADTAVLLKPANVCRFFDVKIRSVLCKPWDF
jgi:hypothetical protein